MLHPSTSERGVGLIEIIVVLVLLIILLGVGIGMMRSSRGAGHSTALISTGLAYRDAIEQFASDHAGRFPRAVATTDWPVANDGPVDPLARRGSGRYMRTLPEPVQAEHVLVGQDGSWGRIDYFPNGDRSGYQLRLRTVDGTDLCSFVTNATPERHRCTID